MSRRCTCHPDDRPWPCPRRYAYSECVAVYRTGLFWLLILCALVVLFGMLANLGG